MHRWSLTPKSAKNQNSRKISNSNSENIEKQMVPCKSTAEEVSFEWSHQRILSTDLKVRTTLHVFIIVSRGERGLDSSRGDRVPLEILGHVFFYCFPFPPRGAKTKFRA